MMLSAFIVLSVYIVSGTAHSAPGENSLPARAKIPALRGWDSQNRQIQTATANRADNKNQQSQSAIINTADSQTATANRADSKNQQSQSAIINTADSQTATANRADNKNQQSQSAIINTADSQTATTNSSGKDQLIAKLQRLIKTLPSNHKALKPLRLRLAHILALRVEELFIQAEKENCLPCAKKASQLAKQSSLIHTEISSFLKARHPLLYTESLFQQAYLQRLAGKRRKSLQSLQQITQQNKISAPLKAKALMGIGEIYFEMYDYKKSLEASNKLLQIPNAPYKTKALYQKIWSLFNLSQYERAVDELEAFLKSDLSAMAKNAEERYLRQKLESELIVLYSPAQVTSERLTFLRHFSKTNESANSLAEKNKRIFDLAQSLSALGRRRESNQAGYFYLSKVQTPKEKIQALLLMTENDLNLNPANSLHTAGPKLKRTFSLLESMEKPEKLKKEARRKAKMLFQLLAPQTASFSEKQKRSLLALQSQYSSLWPEDGCELSRSAFLAKDLKQYGLAQELFQKAVLTSQHTGQATEKAGEKINPDQPSLTEKMKENICFLQMEMAERTQDKARRRKAYNFYIQHGTREDLTFRARYQNSYLDYESKEYEKAAKNFKELALYHPGNKNQEPDLNELRLKAGHLSLSSLEHLSQWEELAQTAGLFIKEFPKNRKEFAPIRNRALLNRIKRLLLGKDFSRRPVESSQDKDILKAWALLRDISLKEAGKETVFSYHFNRLLLAKELLKFEEMDKSFQALLSGPPLDKEDKKIVLTWKLWLAELRFDFKEVLRIMKILQDQEEDSEERLLRLARLAEMAGDSSSAYYVNLIEKFPQSPTALTALLSLIEKSPSAKSKMRFLKTYSFLFKKQPERLTYLVLKIDEGRLDEKFMESFANLDFMKNSPLTHFLRKKQLVESFERELSAVQNLILPEKAGEQKLNRAIKAYNNKIQKLSEKAEKALQTRDGITRFFIISHWERQIARFYKSIMELPLPEGLNEGEKEKYTKLLQNRMEPYRRRLSQLEKERKTLQSQNLLVDYKKNLPRDSVFYGPLKWELQKALSIFQKNNKKEIQKLLTAMDTQSKEERAWEPGEDQTQQFYKALKKNPFDYNSLVRLLQTEKIKNNKLLSSYLANRIKELKKQRINL